MLRAITVQQPWAGLIAARIKPVENRGRRWGNVDELAIHAGRAFDDAALADPLVRHHLTGDELFEARRTAGVIVAVATLTGCHQAERTCCAPWGQQGPGVQHLTLDDVVELDRPVPARGMLGLWTVPDDVEVLVREQVTR